MRDPLLACQPRRHRRQGGMRDLVVFVNRTDLPPVVQAAIAHAQFETIHPFADGNGRVGRALIHVVLRRRSLAPRHVPPVSLVLAADARGYVAGLTAFREDRPADWILAFAHALERAAAKAGELATPTDRDEPSPPFPHRKASRRMK